MEAFTKLNTVRFCYSRKIHNGSVTAKILTNSVRQFMESITINKDTCPNKLKSEDLSSL